MKKIVIKMRSMKKLFGDDLLQLALLLSLMKVRVIDCLPLDPRNYKKVKKFKTKTKNKSQKEHQVQSPHNLVMLFELHMSAKKRI